MSEELYTLLTLPASQAFKDYHPSGFAISLPSISGSSSPPRKTPRLDADSDSASASRSRLLSLDYPTGIAPGKKAAVKIQLVGAPSTRSLSFS